MACNLALAGPGTLLADGPHRHDSQENGDPNDFLTQTPIKHLVVIFQENVSFDHYLATYPNAQPNLDGSVYFQGAKPNTPTVNGLTPSLLTHNPNSKQPFRPDRSQNLTCDMNTITHQSSDGWYDHQLGQIVNQSATEADALTGVGLCGTGASALGGFQGRCGYGPRIPLQVISGWAKKNFVDHGLADQSSILRFIEDNWDLGRIDDSFDALAGPLTNMFDFNHFRHEQVFLDPITGEVVSIQAEGSHHD
jgi:phospholipase C